MRSLYFFLVFSLFAVGGHQATGQSSTELQTLPRFDNPDLKHAAAQVEQGHYQDAVAELQALAAKDPQQKGVARMLGVSYYKLGDYPGAIKALQQAVNEDANDKEAVQLLGLAYYFSGRPKDAIALLEKVQSWFAHANVDASYVLGVCYIQTLNYDQARKAFANTYGVPPDSAASHLFLARMLLRQGFDPVSETEAKKAIELDPKLPLAHYLLGELYIFKSRIPEAIQALETEMKINPGYAGTYDRLADSYTRVMRWEEAERLLQRALWLDPTATGPYVLMGKVLMKKNEPALAARSLERAVTMDPNNYMGHYLLGQAYNALGRRDDGQREIELSQKLQAKKSHSEAEQ